MSGINPWLKLLRERGLVIATHNAGKLREIQAMLAPLAIQCESAGQLGLAEPEENGDSFIANAMIKSSAAAEATGKPALADDSGLVIPALGGAPGIYSARWAGADKNFSHAMARIEQELTAAGQPLNSPAYFVCVLSLAVPAADAPTPMPAPITTPMQSSDYSISAEHIGANRCVNIEGRVHGQLSFPPRGEHGFGYDPIFTAAGMQQSFAQISPQLKHEISHRANAFKGLLTLL